ncbi:MAG: hypothetical protein V3U98_10260 [Acidobacteriota bacterium]
MSVPLALAALGCAPSRRLDAPRLQPPPITWQQQAATIYSKFPAFEAVYRAEWLPTEGRARSFRLWVAASHAERLRLEASGRFGGAWLTLVAVGDEVLAVSHRAAEYILEADAPGLLQTLSGWPLVPSECAGVLLGDLPARLDLTVRAADGSTAGSTPGQHAPAEVAVSSGLARQYRFRLGAGGTLSGSRLELHGRQGSIAQIEYEVWQQFDQVALPSRLKLRQQDGMLMLRLESIAAAPSAAAFELTPPPGFRRRRPGSESLDPDWANPDGR